MVWIQTNAHHLITHDSFTFEVRCLNKKWSYMHDEQLSENWFSLENPLCSGRLDRNKSYDAPPTSAHVWRECKTLSPISPELANALQKFKKHLPYLPNLAPLDFFLLKKSQNGGWEAGAWTRTASRTPGRGSPDHWLPSTSLPPSEACWTTAKSASTSTASLSKNLKK